jgi:hypothetical protein
VAAESSSESVGDSAFVLVAVVLVAVVLVGVVLVGVVLVGVVLVGVVLVGVVLVGVVLVGVLVSDVPGAVVSGALVAGVVVAGFVTVVVTVAGVVASPPPASATPPVPDVPDDAAVVVEAAAAATAALVGVSGAGVAVAVDRAAAVTGAGATVAVAADRAAAVAGAGFTVAVALMVVVERRAARATDGTVGAATSPVPGPSGPILRNGYAGAAAAGGGGAFPMAWAVRAGDGENQATRPTQAAAAAPAVTGAPRRVTRFTAACRNIYLGGGTGMHLRSRSPLSCSASAVQAYSSVGWSACPLPVQSRVLTNESKALSSRSSSSSTVPPNHSTISSTGTCPM